MTDKELAKKLRAIALDFDLAGRTAEWKTLAEVATRLDELDAIREHKELTERLTFWERWSMEWRAVSATLNRAMETTDPNSIRSGLAAYQASRNAYQNELRQLLKVDPQ